MTPETTEPSLYDRVGGADGVRVIVARFYDLIEHRPEYAELRAMHAPDLLPTRLSLADFLGAWLGGPRLWFEQRPGVCIMGLHRDLGISSQTAAQWVHAMSRALAENGIDPALGHQLQRAFLRMANAMAAQ
jgi:hemoglobin